MPLILAPANCGEVERALPDAAKARDAFEDFDIRDSMRGVGPFDTREHTTYTEEEPNSLAPVAVPRFLAKLRELHPGHYAFSFVGIMTGLRPSERVTTLVRRYRELRPVARARYGVLVLERASQLSFDPAGDLLDDELTDRDAGAQYKRVVIVRRSPTLGDEVMDTTKTDLHQCLTLSLQHLEVPRWHVDTCCSARPRPRGWNP